MYEILRLQATDKSDKEQYKAYRFVVKNRLNGPYRVREVNIMEYVFVEYIVVQPILALKVNIVLQVSKKKFDTV